MDQAILDKMDWLGILPFGCDKGVPWLTLHYNCIANGTQKEI